MTELIDLQNSHVTQHTTNGIKSDWSIEKNITDEQIFILPSKLNDMEVAKIMRFIKNYELEAFNTGIKFQKDKQNGFMKDTITTLQKNNSDLARENIRLATILENLLPEG